MKCFLKSIKFFFIITVIIFIFPIENYIIANSSDGLDSNGYDTKPPALTITYLGGSKVYEGDTLTFNVNFSDNIGVSTVDLVQADATKLVRLNGFTGNITITGSGYSSRKITIYNIKGVGTNRSVTIMQGAVLDDDINMSNEATSNAFNIVSRNSGNNSNNNSNSNTQNNSTNNNTNSNNKTNTNIKNSINNNSNSLNYNNKVKEAPKVQQKNTSEENTDEEKKEVTQKQNLKVISEIEEINENFNYSTDDIIFWLRSSKNNITFVQENNYVSKDKELIYMIEYYNSKNDDISNAKFNLTIPEETIVEEINGNGKVIEQTNQNTSLEWNIEKVQSHKGYRLYVKVKFVADQSLEKSSNLSRIFYTRASLNISNKVKYSYLRQLFIDNNISKTAKFLKNYSFIDPYDIARPDDKITRIELLKMLIDYGVILPDYDSDNYKKYSDYKDTMLTYRPALSAAYNTNIISTYQDNKFKPNNPILKDEFMEVLAKVSYILSDAKLKIDVPVYSYDSIMKGKNNKISEYKNEIMELIRQNIISNKNISIDEYITRKEAQKIIASLSLNAPFANKLPADKIVFYKNKYFYGISNLLKNYKYNYDKNLFQNIIY